MRPSSRNWPSRRTQTTHAAARHASLGTPAACVGLGTGTREGRVAFLARTHLLGWAARREVAMGLVFAGWLLVAPLALAVWDLSRVNRSGAATGPPFRRRPAARTWQLAGLPGCHVL